MTQLVRSIRNNGMDVVDKNRVARRRVDMETAKYRLGSVVHEPYPRGQRGGGR